MGLLVTMNLLARLHHGEGLKYDELKKLDLSLQEQLKHVTELREKLERVDNQ